MDHVKDKLVDGCQVKVHRSTGGAWLCPGYGRDGNRLGQSQSDEGTAASPAPDGEGWRWQVMLGQWMIMLGDG